MDFIDRVDPDLVPTLLAFPAGGTIDWSDLPATRRQFAAFLATLTGNVPDDPNIVKEDHTIPGSPGDPKVFVRLYRPRDATGALPGMLWIHGGGMVMGSVAGNDLAVQRIVAATGCLVVSVEYRLAPEHPFPAPVEDCYAALRWMYAHANEIGLDPTRLAIGGGSAGGGLAAGLALLARDRGEVPISFQLLIYPMIDDRNITPSSHAITEGRVWNRTANLNGWRAYLGVEPGSDGVSPYAAAARVDNLAGLPPAYIMVGTLDLFIDEDIVYAQRLIEAKVPVELHIYPGAFHGSEGFGPTAPLSRRMTADRNEAIMRGLRIGQ